ncbi:hypothetical protein ACSVIJ_23235, partial [Pseudomonas sp. NCHU5208]|uniref:hypothetical protein n=1 Tax=unclassified Pseudomonas TaxID=196821 RepID=UPI003F9E08E8
FFALGGNPISKKSESPEGAKPGISENTAAASKTQKTQKLASPLSKLTFSIFREEPYSVPV